MSYNILNQKKETVVLLHIAAWVAYGSLIYFTNLLTNPDVTVVSTALYLLPFSLTFYTTLGCLYVQKGRSIAWAVVVFFIVFIVMALLSYCYIYILLPYFGMVLYTDAHIRLFLQTAILGFVQMFSYALIYFYIGKAFGLERERMKNELENAKLKELELTARQEKLEYEHAFLRAQINPHFLHNTLNTLFSQALPHSPQLADNIMKLSEMMRYSFDSVENKSGKTPVQQELNNIQTLLDIYNIRFNESNIEYTIEGEEIGQMVPPLSFITIIENALKYGEMKSPDNPIRIKVVLKKTKVYLYCRNKKRTGKIAISSNNVGISNLKKRMDVAFRDKYEMKINNEENFYTIELTIKQDLYD